MLTVTLDIFSGRRNPYWTLTPKEEGELIDRVTANPSLIGPVSAPTRGLGYRGYIVSMSKRATPGKQRIPSRFRIGHLKLDKDAAASWLLDTSEKPDTEVDDYLREVAQRSILAPIAPPAQPIATPAKSSGPGSLEKDSSCPDNYLDSDTDFSYWNDSYSVDNNNCYNFAANDRSDTFAQPGNQSGHPFASTTCSSVGNACSWDGWVSSCQSNNLSIALVIWPGRDFHFYRLCQNGHWCHKPGHTPARNYDDSYNFITDPRTCNRGNYTDFCSFLNADNTTMFVS